MGRRLAAVLPLPVGLLLDDTSCYRVLAARSFARSLSRFTADAILKTPSSVHLYSHPIGRQTRARGKNEEEPFVTVKLSNELTQWEDEEDESGRAGSFRNE